MQGRYKNLVEMQEKSCATFKDRELFGTKGPNGYEYITYGQFAELVDQFRGGLASLGVSPGDKVSVISDNGVKWAIGAYATYGLGAHYVPMYENMSLKDWKYIIEDSSTKVLLVSNKEIYTQTNALVGEIESLQHVVNLGGTEDNNTSYEGLLRIGREKPVASSLPDPDDLMGLIYTSGTTGNPKGVMLSHYNIISNIAAMQDILDLTPEDRTLSFLPWAHVFGQTVELHGIVSIGMSTAFAESVSTIVDNLAEVRPTVLCAVPRIFNKIYDGVNAKIQDQGGLAKYLFEKGMEKANKKRQNNDKLGVLDGLVLKVADSIVFSKIRGRFGGRLKYAVSGASALSKEVAEFIDNMGIMVYEGYGLSETSPMVSANSKHGRKIGSVGRPIPNVKVILDKSVVGENSESGEIVVYGPNIMKGYHNLPEATAEVMTDDGGFKTGDLGTFDEDGFLFITGRIKEQYKLENGKYVVPSPLEEKLKLSPYISQVMIHGANKLYNVALIVAEMPVLEKFAMEQGINATQDGLVNDERVKQLIAEEIEKFSTTFKGFERVKKFALVNEEWSVDNDMLTPTMKLKRRVVFQKYENLIESLYA